MAKTFSSPYPKGIVAAYKTYDTTNESSDRDTLKDLTGNGHDILLKNFLYKLNSGYGLYQIDLSVANFNAVVTTLVTPYKLIFSSNLGRTISFSMSNISSFTDTLNLRISNILKGNRVNCRYYSPSTDYVEISAITSDGIISIPRDSLPSGVTNLIIGGSITFKDLIVEQIPEYKGGLVLDSIDDYGICENFPILIKDKGYTVCAIRKFLSLDKNQCFLSNRPLSAEGLNSAFTIELKLADPVGWVTRSFSTTNTNIPIPEESVFTYQTHNKYNNTTLGEANILAGTKYLTLGNLYPDSTAYTANMVFYALEVYDRDLTPEEIKSVEDRMMSEWYEKAFDEKTLKANNI